MEEQQATRGSVLDSLSYLIFTLLIFVTPFAFLPFGAPVLEAGKFLVVAILAIASLVLWLSARLIDGRLAAPKNPVFIAGLLLLVVSLLSALFSGYVEESLIGLGFENDTFAAVLLMMIILFMGSVLLAGAARIKRVLSLILVSSLVVFVLQLLRFFGFDFFGVLPAATDTLVGKWNDMASFFGLTALLSGLALESKSGLIAKKRTLMIVFVLSLFALVVLNFSLVWWTLGVIALVASIWRFMLSRSSSVAENVSVETGEGEKIPVKRVSKFLTPSTIVLLLSIVMIIWSSQSSSVAISSRLRAAINLPSSPLEVRPSWGGTWETAKGSFEDNLILGVGQNRFDNAWVLHKPASTNQSVFWSVDFNRGIGYLPTSLVTTGVLGALAWLVFLLSLLWLMKRVMKDETLSSHRPVAKLLLVASVYTWAIVLLYTPNITMLTLAFVFAGLLLALLSLGGNLPNLNWQRGDGRTSTVVTVAIVIALIASGAFGFLFIDKHAAFAAHQEAQALASEGDVDAALVSAERALSLNSYDMFYRSLSSLYMSRFASEVTSVDSNNPDTQLDPISTYSLAVDNGIKAVNAAPNEYLNWLALGDTYASVVTLGVEGSYEQAVRVYAEGFIRNPNNPSIPFRLARVELARGEAEAAKQLINAALAVKPNYTPAYFLLSQIAIEEGDVGTAIASTERGVISSPQDPSAFFQLGFLRYQNSDYTEAALALENAVILQPRYSNAKYFLGLSYYQLGRDEEALAQFRDVLTLNPENGDVAAIVSNLELGLSPFSPTSPPVVEDDEE